MRYLKVSDNSTRAELEAAMVALRAKQQACCVALIRNEIGEDLDEVLELWMARA